MTILVCDDDKEIVEAIEIYLMQEGYDVEKAYDGIQAVEIMKNKKIDLMIIDVMMPKLDGIRATLQIRKESRVPIIILSAKTEDADKILGLNVGADDYVTKPFGSAELLARMRSALRTGRQHGTGETDGRLCIGALTIDCDARRVFAGESEVRLTQTEYNLLLLLAENSGRMMTYQKVIKAVWGEGVNEANIKKLQVNIANIRKKFAGVSVPLPGIRNELGVGYRLDG